MDLIAELAERQLAAYNAHDLDAFCACYADDVRVLDAEGTATLVGIESFRQRYQALFEGFSGVGARVDERLVLGRHCVDLERWWRTNRDGETSGGTVLVRYTASGDRIGTVEFLAP